jgi:formamidopyrimidine-DNA glycosylase
MPELPEVENVRRTLKSSILGKEIKEIDIFYPKIITGDVEEFIDAVKGQRIVDIKRMGKFLIFILENTAFISHLRMEGKYRYISKPNIQELADDKKGLVNNVAVTVETILPKESEENKLGRFTEKHDHVMFRLEDDSLLYYNDTRKFGRLQLIDKEDYGVAPPLSQLGPEPWNAKVSQLYDKIHKSKLPIKAILLDQRIIAGIGNIYANEICFQVGLNPHTLGSDLSKKRIGELIESSKEILEESIKVGGTTIYSFSNDGQPGGYQQQLKVHGQKLCPTCGGEISKEKIKGRGTYYCKNCQKSKR